MRSLWAHTDACKDSTGRDFRDTTCATSPRAHKLRDDSEWQHGMQRFKQKHFKWIVKGIFIDFSMLPARKVVSPKSLPGRWKRTFGSFLQSTWQKPVCKTVVQKCQHFTPAMFDFIPGLKAKKQRKYSAHYSAAGDERGLGSGFRLRNGGNFIVTGGNVKWSLFVTEAGTTSLENSGFLSFFFSSSYFLSCLSPQWGRWLYCA